MILTAGHLMWITRIYVSCHDCLICQNKNKINTNWLLFSIAAWRSKPGADFDLER
jgi:hypothetical protein